MDSVPSLLDIYTFHQITANTETEGVQFDWKETFLYFSSKNLLTNLESVRKNLEY